MTWWKKNYAKLGWGLAVAGWLAGAIFLGIKIFDDKKQNQEKGRIEEMLSETRQKLTSLENEDQYKINQELAAQIGEIKTTFELAVEAYEEMLEMETKIKDTTGLRTIFAEVLFNIFEFNYASASASLKKLGEEIEKKEQELAVAEIPKTMANVPETASPPESGYARQKVTGEFGSFIVSIVSADLSSSRVIVGTAASGDCADNCPVKSLAAYVSENGAYAGVNGTYFCPATYPDCANKKNSFDLLVMNKDKTYVNSDNNVYSNNPAVIFGDNYVRFVTSVSQWGRDTSVTGVISNYPLLVFNKEVVFGGDGDPKKGSKGNRSFVANVGNKVFIGVVHNATVAESALVLKTMGMENAMNLDNGGSTALWSGGYKVGPGRDLPNVIMLVKK